MSAGRKAAGNSQRLAKTGACRGFASKPAPFFNARRCSFLFPHFSQGGDCCALRATMIYYDLTSSILSFSRPRPAGSHCENSGKSDDTCASARSDRAKSAVFRDRSASAGVVIRYFSPCLIFWCFWIKTKAHKKEYAPQKKSILRKEFRRQDRLRRICGPKAAGHAHGGGPPQAETSTRTAQRPAIFQAGLWGFARPKPGLHGTLLREFPKSSFKQEISARPAPFRPARPSRHPEGQQTYRKEHTPPDKQREPFPMKRFPFSFPRRIPPDPA